MFWGAQPGGPEGVGRNERYTFKTDVFVGKENNPGRHLE